MIADESGVKKGPPFVLILYLDVVPILAITISRGKVRTILPP